MTAVILVDVKVSYDRQGANAKAINAMSALARGYIHRHTLLWGTDGLRALPVAMWEDFNQEVESFKRDLKEKGCDLQVYYIAYPHNNYEEKLNNQKLFNALSLELVRRCDLMERDLLTRVEQVVFDLNQRLKMDFVDGEARPRRFHEETVRGLTYEVKLFRFFNDVLKNNTLSETLDSLSDLAAYEVQDIRKDAAVRQEVWQKTVDLLKLLSNA
jgi:hypothetical protein